LAHPAQVVSKGIALGEDSMRPPDDPLTLHREALEPLATQHDHDTQRSLQLPDPSRKRRLET
jgi:hypothetical protein